MCKALLQLHGGQTWAQAVKEKRVVDMTGFCSALMSQTRSVWKDVADSDPRSDVSANRKLVVYEKWMAAYWNGDKRPPLPAYLCVPLPADVVRNVARARVSSHCCKVETGRYARPATAWRDRKCDKCDMGQVQDEHHVLLECSALDSVRADYMHVLGNSDWTMKQLMRFTDVQGVSLFVSDCMRTVDNWYYMEDNVRRRAA